VEISNGATLNILDIDLDFFLNRRHTGPALPERLDGDNYKPWDEADVRRFLELNCGLSTARRVPGAFYVEHVGVFHRLRQWQEEREYSLRFRIDHVDAHADLGMGDTSYKYIFEEILQLEPVERAYPRETGGWEKLSSANFLAFAIACGWVSRLTYINDASLMIDLPWLLFRNLDVDSGAIQLKRYSKAQMDKIINGNGGDMRKAAAKTTPLELAPEVPFSRNDYRNFRAESPYGFIFLTQSPGYTPATSDALIPVIQSYMEIAV
jgi:hypothetical protein